MPDATTPSDPQTPAWRVLLWVAYGACALLILAVAALAFRLVPAPDPAAREGLAYILAFVFGALVGATELSGRYRDRPLEVIRSEPGQIYMLVNAVAALATVWLLFSGRLVLGVSLFGKDHPLLDALVIGSFGAMAVFRSSIFTVRVRDTSVAVGPAAVLQELLRVIDREADKRRAEPRALGVRKIMDGVVFRRARDTLPAHCLNLMQNVAPEERETLTLAIDSLEKQKVSDEAKSYSLGLLLMNLVGQEVLSQAVAGLGDRIRGPLPDDPPVLENIAAVVEADLKPLLEFAAALEPRRAEALVEERRRKAPGFTLDDLIAPPDGLDSASRERVLVALARLRHAFGQETVAEALRLLIPLRANVVRGNLGVEALGGAAPSGPAGGETLPRDAVGSDTLPRDAAGDDAASAGGAEAAGVSGGNGDGAPVPPQPATLPDEGPKTPA